MTGTWKRSSECSAGGQCVEVRRLPDGGAEVRDSKNPGVVLRFRADEWAAFLAGAAAGEFDGEAVE